MRRRLENMLGAAALFVTLLVTYRLVINPVYDYYGMGWKESNEIVLVVALLMNMSIAFVASPAFTRPSQAFFAVQFLIVFLPASIVCPNTTLPDIPASDVMYMLLAMYVGLLMQALVHLVSARRHRGLRRGRFDRATVFRAMAAFALVTLALSFYTLRDIFSISALDSIYAQRDLLDDQSLGAAYRYGLSWLNVLLLPTLFIGALKLERRARLIGIVACVLGYVVLFGLTATKTSLLAPLIIAGFYALLKPRRLSYLTVFPIFLSLLLIIPLAMAPFESLAGVNFIYTGMVNFRIFSVPHILYVQYLDFFQNHPLTHGSHISIINQIVAYPFDAPVFLLVGEEFYPGSNMTANVGMWGQDGIASFGIAGILIVSVLFTAAMAVLDKAAEGHEPRSVGAILSMMTLFIANASLFTTLVTGGLLLAIVLLRVTKRAAVPGTRRARAWTRARRPTENPPGLHELPA